MKIGRYEILEVIGQGAMGIVYKALDPLIERTVAIKTVPIAQLKEESSEFEARFLREAQSAGRLSHPNIVTIYDVGETDDLAYIAMEYLSGTTLREIMDKGPIPLDLVAATASQIAEALAYAHEHGVVHRDIKPSNIVITLPHGQVKLTDFGIAHLVNSEKTTAGLMLGSPRYMSPEQAMGQEINGRSDIFSLGAVLYEMLTGEYAFNGESLPSILYGVINTTPVLPTLLRPEISVSFETLVMNMLSKQTEARIDSAALPLQLQRIGEHNLLPGPSRENYVPPLISIVAFSTPMAVLMITAVGMIVINYFLTFNIKSPPLQTIVLKSPRNDVPEIPQNIKPQRPQAPLSDPIQPEPRKKPSRLSAQEAYLQGLEDKKVELEIKKTELLLQYTLRHPDVVDIKRQLKQLEAERKRYILKQKETAHSKSAS